MSPISTGRPTGQQRQEGRGFRMPCGRVFDLALHAGLEGELLLPPEDGIELVLGDVDLTVGQLVRSVLLGCASGHQPAGGCTPDYTTPSHDIVGQVDVAYPIPNSLGQLPGEAAHIDGLLLHVEEEVGCLLEGKPRGVGASYVVNKVHALVSRTSPQFPMRSRYRPAGFKCRSPALSSSCASGGSPSSSRVPSSSQGLASSSLPPPERDRRRPARRSLGLVREEAQGRS